MLNHPLDSLSTLLFPVSCLGCGRIVGSLSFGHSCESCWKSVRWFDGSQALCGKCGAFPGESPSIRPYYCGDCRDFHFDIARAAGTYEGGLAVTVLQLKKIPYLPDRALNALLLSANKLDLDEPTIVIPVPLSKQRNLERGFNQAAVIGNAIAARLGLEFDQHSLQRFKHTPMHRAGMDRKAREASVIKAFEVVRPKLVNNKNVLLVDDVMTSGSTVSQCAYALKMGGALKVNVLTLARASSH